MFADFFRVFACETIAVPKNSNPQKEYLVEEMCENLKTCVKKNVSCFDVTEIDSFAFDLSQDFISKDIKLPQDLKVPSDCCAFIKAHAPDTVLYLHKIYQSSQYVISYVNDINYHFIGTIDTETKEINPDFLYSAAVKSKTEYTKEELQYIYDQDLKLIGMVCAYILIITNNEIVNAEPYGMRKLRLAAKRVMKIKEFSVGKIRWNTKYKLSFSKKNGEPQYHLPLHWRRGYWRRSEENHPKSEMRPYALNQEDRKKWWTWIDGYWAGHPAFGFKKSIYQPYVGDNKNV